MDNGSSGINPRVASAATLRSVPGLGDARVSAYLSRRRQHRLESPAIRSAQRFFNDRLSSVYTISTEARVGDVTAGTRARVRLSTDRRQPYQILRWMESDFGTEYDL